MKTVFFESLHYKFITKNDFYYGSCPDIRIDWCYHAIHKHSCKSQRKSVLTTCTFMFLQVCTVEISFFKATHTLEQ